MNCPCPICNGVNFQERFPAQGNDAPEYVEEQKEIKSVSERLEDLSKELERAGVRGSLITEVNEIGEEVDSIDTEITHIQANGDVGGDSQIQLGELSKRLY